MLLVPVAASAATTASLYPTTVVTGNGWTNPTNAYSQNTTYATAAPAKNVTVSGHWGGFDVSSVPTGSTAISVAITCRYRVSTNTSTATLTYQPFSGGGAIGTAAQDTAEPTTDTSVSASFSVTEAQLRAADFEVSVDADRSNSNTAVTFSLDAVWVVVTYTPPVAPGAPGAPAAITPTTTTSMTATWTASTGTVTTYTLQVDTENTFAAPLTGSYTPATNSQSVTGLAANTLYYLRASATGPGGTSAWSTTGQGTTLSNTPNQPTFANTTSSSTDVSWTVTGNGGAAVTYTLDRATDSGFTANLVSTPGLTGTTANVTGLNPTTTYWFRVRVVNAGGTTAWSTSNSVLTLTPPGTPGTPSATVPTATTSMTATWTASTGTVTSYTLQVDTENTFAAPLTASYTPATNSQSVTGLAANTLYYLRASATGPGGTSGWSGTGQGTTLSNTPNQPTFANTTGTTTDVSWTVTGNGGAAVTYTLDRATDAGFTQNLVSTPGLTGTTANVTGLNPTTTYWFRVRVVNAGGTTAWSTSNSVLTLTPPGTPGTPAATLPTATTSMTTTWTASTGTVTTYTLQVDTENTFAAPLTGSYTPATNSQSVTGLAANTLYYLRASATGPGGTSGWSGTGQATTLSNTPNQPTSANTTGTTTDVSWTVTGNGGASVTYTLDRATDSGFTANLVSTPGLTATTANVTGLNPSTTYWFRVRAVNAGGTTAWSTSNSVLTPTAPSAPGAPNYPSVGATALTASWTASATGSAPITYALQWSANGTSGWTDVTGCSGVGLLTCNVTSLTSNTLYYYRVVATNSAGTGTSANSSQRTLPGQPAMAAYSGVGQTAVTVNWTMAGTTTGLTYAVQRGDSASGPWTTVSGCGAVAAPATSCGDSGLTAGGTYWYQVQATNAAGSGAWATSTSVTLNAAPTAPSAPGTPSYASVAAATLTVNWAPSATGSAPITYALQWSATGSAPWNNVSGCSSVDLGTCNVTGLTGNTTYHYQVVATNSGGSATSGSSSQLTRPGQPAPPTFGTVTTTSIVVSWAAPTGPSTGLTFNLDRAKDAAFTQELVSSTGLTGTSTTASGLTAGTTYYFRIAAANATGAGQPSGTATQSTQAPVVGTTVGNGTDPTPVTIAPGDAATAVDAFTLQTDSGSDAVSSATVRLAAGTWAGLSAVSVQNTNACSQATPYGTQAPSSDTVVVPLTGVTATATLSNLWVCVTPKPHAAMPAPPGGTYAVTATVTSVASTNAKTYNDTASGTVTIDNKSPANVRWSAVTTGDQQIVLNWTNPTDADFADVVVLRSTAPVAAVPAEGTSYAQGNTIGASEVRYAGNLQTFTDTGLTNGTAYYYKAFARDSRGNYAVGISAGPGYPGTGALSVGSSDPARPVVAILNPGNGAIASGQFRVQVRVWSPADPIQAVELSTNGGSSWTALTKSANYAPTATSGVWEGQVTLASGASYTLYARGHNSPPGCDPTGLVTPGDTADDCVWVNSAPVRIVVKTANTGDGRLIVRDDSSQLCADCHSHKTHSSESLGTAKGAWTTVCRDCHTPHGTTNIYLVPTQITPPPRGSNVPAARDVVFLSKEGAVDTSGSSTPTGVCQVCHQQTEVYKADGTGASHYTGDCAGCHKHSDGLKASCTDCHGTKDRTATVANADSNIASAPPDLAHDPADPLKTPTATGAVQNGVHLAHVDENGFRSAPLQCTACHQTNQHKDGNADVAWGPVATGNGAFSPSPATGPVGAGFSTTPTCTTWCHGNGLAGNGRGLTWSWNGTRALTCGSCHGQSDSVAMPAQAAAHHPQNPTCASCHGVDYNTGDKTKHIDGTVQHPTGCTACHGQLSGLAGTPVASGSPKAAPGYDTSSVDTKGNTERTFVGVGAHAKHIFDGSVMSAKCAECHVIPATDDVSHANGATAWSWTAQQGLTPQYASGTCSNFYCHSNAKPLGEGTATAVPMTWTSTSPVGCTSCHSNTIGVAGLSSRHGTHLNYGFTCDECHALTISNDSTTSIGTVANHVNGVKDVGFSTTALPVQIAQQGGEYSGSPGYGCTSTYCHSDGTKTSAPFGAPVGAALSWLNGTTSTKCDNCHGGNALADFPIATPSHAAHVNNASYLGTNIGCAKCHANTVTDDRTIGTPANHVNGVHNVSADGWDGTSTCSSNYCHSNGTEPPLAGLDYKPVTWGVTALGSECKDCHGTDTGSVAGAPWYGNNDATFKTRNSHQKHVSSANDCVSCHDQTVTATGTIIADGSTRHLDGSRDVHGPKIGSYNEGTETCSSVTCHGGASPQWGGAAMKCADCHVGTGDLNDWNIRNDVASRLDSGEWTGSGHGAASVGLGGANPCLYCHDDAIGHKVDTNPFRLRGAANASGVTAAYDPASATNGNDICINCHDVDAGARYGVDPDGGSSGYALAKATSKFVDAWHYGADHSATLDGGTRCWDCHDVHGDGNLHMIGADVLPDSPDSYGLASAAARVSVSFTSDAAGGYTNTTTPRTGVCQSCHTSTTYWTSAGTGEDHNAGSDCVSCHSHQNPVKYKAFEGAGACSACHMGAASASSDTDRDEFPPVYSGGTNKSLVDPEDWLLTGHGNTSTYAQSGNAGAKFPAATQTVEPCYYCHAPDTALFTGGETSKHADVATTNPFRLLNTSNGANPNGVCLVCHASGSAGFDPDGGGNAAYSSINRTSSKAISATHYGAKHTAAGTTGGRLCWDCHDPHGDYNYGTGRAIAYMVQAKPTITSTTAFGTDATVTTTVVDFNNGGNGFDATDYVTAGNAGVCQVCHTATKYWTSAGGGKTHMATGARCIACHGHQQGTTDAFKQLTSCTDCHNAPPTLGKHSAHDETTFAETDYANKARHASTTQYGFACNTCHSGTHWSSANPFSVDVAFSSFDAVTVGGGYTAGGAQTADTFDTANGTLSYSWTNGSCGTTYCHSNATPVGGTVLNNAPTWAETAWTATNRCTKCHKMSADNTGLATSTNLSHAHYVHTATTATSGYFFSCTQCHNTVVSSGASDYPTTAGTIKDKTLHVSGSHNVAFDATVNPGATAYNQGPAYTCNNTYCHSNGSNAASPPANTSIAWNTSVAADCSSCHGGYTGAGIVASGKHPAHANNATWLGTSYYCVDCHATTVTGTTTPAVNYAGGKHVNRTKDVSIGARPSGGISYDTGTTCSNTYCHSDGQRGAANTRWNVTWSDAAWATTPAPGICVKCHGTEGGSIAGEPRYANGGANSATSNSHAAHVKAGTDCATCHNGIVNAAGTAITSTSHTNGAIDTVFDLTKAGTNAINTDGTFTAPSTYVSASCTSVACHGTNTTAVSWGTTLDCSGCHMGATGTTDAEVDNFNYGDGTTAKLDPEDWINYGHGRPTASGNYDSGNPAAGFDTAIGVSSDDGCKYCHDKNVSHGQFGAATNPFRLANIGAGNTVVLKNGVCTVCHGGPGYLTKTATKAVDASHYGAKHTSAGTTGGQLCWDCHDPHGDSRYTTNAAETPVVATNEALGHMIDAKLVRSHPTADGNATEWGTNGTAGPAYAASSPRFVSTLNGTAGYQWGDYATATYVGVCQVCHTGTTRFLASGSTWAADSTHNNTGSPVCTSCHAHDQPPTNAFQASCTSCHNAPPTLGKHLNHDETTFSETSYTNNARHASSTQYGFACNSCHNATHLDTSGNPRSAQVTFGTFDGTTTVGGGYTAGAAQTADSFTGSSGTYTYNWTNGSCGTTYCHSNATPVGGTVLNNGPTWAAAAWTKTGTTANQCTQCHKMTADNTGLATSTNLSHAHYLHTTTNANSGYYYSCSQCHNGVADGKADYPANNTTFPASILDKTLHVSGSHNISFDVAMNPGQTGYTQASGTPAYTCNNTYCHSNGTTTTAPFTPSASIAWNTQVASNCSSCHGGYTGTVIGTGKHTAHANNATWLGTSYYCADCHATTVTGTTTPVVSYAGGKHVNRTRDVSIGTRPSGGASYDTGTTCSNTYCHSDGQRGAANTRWSVGWSDAAWATTPAPGICVKCHGTEGGSIAGEPRYANGGANTATSNSHAAHVTAGADCATCHNGIVNAAGTAITSTSHTNGAIDTVFDLTKAGSTAINTDGSYTAPNYTSASCTSVKCHGTNTTPVSWGATLDCSGCHMGATGTTDAEVDNYNYGDGTTAMLDPEDWINYGHGRPTASGAYDSGNPAAAFDTAIGVSSDDGCKYCHDKNVSHGQFGTSANPFRLANIGAGNTVVLKNGVCTVCHGGPGYLTKTATKAVDASHYGAKHTSAGTTGGQLCWDCHDPHGDSRYTTNATETPVVAANQLLGHMIDAKLVTSHPTAEGNTTEWGTNGTTGPTYAAKSPVFNKAVGGSTTTYDWADYAVAGTNYNGVCQVCHTATTRFLASGTTWTNDSAHNTTGSPTCVSCHAHDQPPTNAFLASCTSCHNAPPTLGKHLNHDEVTTFTESSYANNTRHASTTQYGFACNTCHNATHLNTSGNPRSAEVTFGTFDGTTTVGGGYTAGAAQTADSFTGTSGTYTYNWTNGSCGTTYCHSNATPLGGTVLNNAVTWNETAWTATNKCTKCHKMAADNTGLATSQNLSHAHYLHTAATGSSGYFYSCTQCHNAVVSSGASDYPTTAGTIKDKTLHVSGSHNVAFDTAVNPGQTGYNGAAYTCSNTYCHSNGTNAATPPANTSIAWNASVASNCTSCHGGYTGTIISSGKHTQHANNTTWLGSTNHYCVDCHSTTVTGTTTPVVSYGGGKHVNRTKDVSIAARTGGQVSYDTSTTCSNTYCHSNGRRNSNTRWNVTWSDTAWATTPAPGICVKCHGTEGGSISGEPRYANGGADTATANSHAKHVDAGGDCATCHNGFVNSTGTVVAGAKHADGVIDVAFDTTKAGANATHADGTTAPLSATCTSIACHGTNTTAVKWGATLDCSACHMGATGATDAEVDNFNYGDGVTAKLDPEDWNSYGHGHSGTAYDSGNPAAAFDANGLVVSSDDGCKYCHDGNAPHGQFGTSGNPFRLANIGAGNTAALKNGVCTICHAGGAGYLGKTATKVVTAQHYGADHQTAGTFGGQLCWDCHDPHGDSRYTTNASETPVVAANELLGHMIDAKIVRTHPTVEGNTTEWGTNGTTGPTYATNSPRFNKSLVTPTTSYDWGDYALASPYNGICQVCHTATTRFKADGTTWTAATNPDSGASGHNTTQNCTASCHAHQQPPTDAFKGAGSCTSCHKVRTGSLPRAAITGPDATTGGDDFIRPSRHVSNGTTTSIVTDFDCILCHTEGDITSSGTTIKTDTTKHGGDGGTATKTVDLRNVDSADAKGVAVAWNGARLLSQTGRNITSTMRDQMDTFCMNCHDQDGAKNITVNRNAVASGMLYPSTAVTTPRTPFNVNDNQQNNRDTAALNALRLNAGVLNVKDQFNSTNAVGKNWASHHNLNQFQKRYSTRNTQYWVNGAWVGTTKDGVSLVTAGETAGLHCSDCHLNESNAHGSRFTYYMLSNSAGNDTTFTGTMTTSSTDVCAKCHAATTYTNVTTGATTTNSRFNHADCASFSYTTMAYLGGASAAGIRCLGCHGGYQFGTIHGTNGTYKPLGSGTAVKQYRFLGSGGTWRYYSPNGTATVTDADWEAQTNVGCYTIGTADAWGGCTKHTAVKTSASNRTRKLEY